MVAAPLEGAYELWRVVASDGRVERLTQDRHVLSRRMRRRGADGVRVAAVRQTATAPAEVVGFEVAAPRQAAPAPSRRGHAPR